ncbi:DUF427 domain-containing protein [Cryptosporangium phraense]|uniref:DUF427 domain-containing protein n=1 Tax=Cryptosporangium phraense TaxID=2593070 RepID=A0A545AJN6_9ACTN|nr:DUF427 domain-containing protein [Cryptosporangium phraense]TQS40935.1 DUF427 domain-containing protein [Cryptosporangium phraense]
MSNRGLVRVETGRKRVRALAGGRVVADTDAPVLVWEKPYYPTYYLPRDDVLAELVATGEVSRSPSRGDGLVHDVVLPDRTLKSAAVTHPDSPLPELRALVRLDWASMDEWLEEDEPVYVHPRDPYKRVDILSSSRHVQVSLDGVVVADSRQPRILFETSLPPRYYLPITDVRLDLLRPTTLVTHCPYKGAATYWDVVLDTGAVHSNVVWTYRTPLPESQKVTGLLAFYDEKVDVAIDGVQQDRPVTHF